MAPVPTQTILVPSASSSPLPSTSSISLMPFSLAHDGPAPISTYFHPRPFEAATSATSKVEGDAATAHRQASFRGRRIVSSTLALPEGYRGLVYSTTAPSPPTVAVEEEDGTAVEREERAAKRAKRAAASAAALDTADVTTEDSTGLEVADESLTVRRSPRKSTTAASSRARERAVRAAKDKARRKAAQDAAKKGGFSLDSDEDDEDGPMETEPVVAAPAAIANDATEITQPAEGTALFAAGLDGDTSKNTAEAALDESTTADAAAAIVKMDEPMEEAETRSPPPPPLRTLSTVSTASSGIITSTPRPASPVPSPSTKDVQIDHQIPASVAQDDEPVTLARDEKRLVPCLTFDRIEVWNPDWPLAGGKVAENDEVGRAVTEWIGLAAKIHAY
ncbi:hypothetical protein BMF94_1392 [Rhodotorula taiwanensis]|uniref:Uncharacterized protein n=1 Tax=Rhodotorula taiwanensis TaxID=741276 RepID=A0A2S5BFF2_9BASI|nr:hypothetical protein BMF94_1392 [Rhodotorula taiwanensis]